MAIDLKKKKGKQPVQENYNKSLTTYPTSGSGEGYTSIGNNYNSSWNGSFQVGGSLPGATGYMYARHGAPDNNKYAKKTKPSAQSGASMKYYQNGLDYLPKGMKKGGVIEDDRGQWEHPGKVTKINSNNITMQGVPYPVIGISDSGDTQLMYPEQNYKFHGNSVTEYPLLEGGGSIQDKGQLQKLDDLTNFTNYNNMKKAQIGARMQATNPQFKMEQYKPIDMEAFVTSKQEPIQQQAPAAGGQGGGMGMDSIMKLFGSAGGSGGGGAESLAGLAKYGGNFSNKKGKLDVKKLNRVLAKNGYEIKKAQVGGYFDSANVDPQAGAWGNYDTTITAPTGVQTYASGSQVDPYDTSYQTNNNPNQFSVSTQKNKQSNWSKFSNGVNKAQAANPSSDIPFFGPTLGIINDIEQIGRDKKEAKKQHGVTSAVIAAMNSKPMVQNAQYVRPENTAFQPGQLNSPQGAGTNYLAANGTRVPGNPSEIQNTFVPNNIYTDSGYEPLHDSDNIKQFQFGGSSGPYRGGQKLGEDYGGNVGKGAGMAIAGPAGAMIGEAAGKFLGKGVANLFGANKLNEQYERDQAALDAANLSNQIGGLQGQNAAFMENGGWMNPNYNPQVITKFDGHDARTTQMHQMRSGGHISEEYKAPNQSSYMEEGGELQTHWGGKAEPISYNPYLPEGGETVMFKGASHKDGGIGVTYGNNPVEVQGGEPATKLQDGGEGGNNLVVFGGMKISPLAAKEIGDAKAIGKKYQTYAKEISKNEAKATKTLNDATELIDNHTSSDPFSQLAFSSGQAKLIGAQMQLKNAAQKKQAAGIVQNAILDTADEHNLVADKLAENKIVPMSKKDMKAKWGKAITKAQWGTSKSPLMKYDDNGELLVSNDGGNTYSLVNSDGGVKSIPQQYSLQAGQIQPISNSNDVLSDNIISKQLDNIPSITVNKSYPSPNDKGYVHTWKGNKTGLKAKTASPYTDDQVNAQLYAEGFRYDPKSKLTAEEQATQFVHDKYPDEVEKHHKEQYGKEYSKDTKTNKLFGSDYIFGLFNGTTPETTIQPKEAPIYQGKKVEPVVPSTPQEQAQKGPGWERFLPMLNPLLRHKYSANLDPSQLQGEYYALSHNGLEPVKAQQFNPLLQSPYDISYQDQLNANQADFLTGLKFAGENNPALASTLLGQKYAANEKVLGEQFRQNQAERAKVYGENRNILNDAQLKNLGILDNQYTRQEQAKSNTKAQAINALTSIGDKIAQSKRDANSMNMYSALNPNFYVDNDGTFHNQGFASFNTEGTGQLNDYQKLITDKANSKRDAEVLKEKVNEKLGKKESAGKIQSRNSNIVKAIKNTKLYK